MTLQYPVDRTALLLVDPYNDFLSEGGKLFAHSKAVRDAVGTLDNMRAIMQAVRTAGIRVFCVPHHRAKLTDFAGWSHPTPYQLGGHKAQVFADGTWGGEWHPDFVPGPDDVMVKEHWNSSGFANTDLDIQLKQHGLSKLILIGMLANTCLESTGKFAVELGYHVTLVRDATAAFSADAMRVAHEINGPTYAHSILSTADLLKAMAAPS